jgi:hypothetical protein
VILDGERPSILNARDGKILRLVPRQVRLPPPSLFDHVARALATVPGLDEVVEHNLRVPVKNKKIVMLLGRSHAYRLAGVTKQAEQDARAALAALDAHDPVTDLPRNVEVALCRVVVAGDIALAMAVAGHDFTNNAVAGPTEALRHVARAEEHVRRCSALRDHDTLALFLTTLLDRCLERCPDNHRYV